MSHEHHNHHHHIAGEANEPLNFSSEFDAGSRSLADALRISFAVLKIIMVVLVILFFSSGVFTVAPDERAMVLRFGKIRGETTEQRILEPGLHWAIPYPVEEVIKLPARNTILRAEINSFWYDETNKFPSRSLDPMLEGYCITRNDTVADLKDGGSDYNIVHSKWLLTYKISDCEMFYKNVSVKTPDAGQTLIDVIPKSVEPFLRAVASEAIVVTMVNFSIDEAIKSDSRMSRETEKLLQQKLDAMNSGIEIDSVQLTSVVWPKQLDDSFVASIKASNEADRMIREARGYAESRINEAGGKEMIDGILSPDTKDEQKEYYWNNASGTVQQIIAESKAYRTKVVESAKANADYLQKLLPEYRKRPKLVLQRIYQDAIEEVLSNTQETIIAQPSSGAKNREFRVMINRDPAAVKKKQQE